MTRQGARPEKAIIAANLDKAITAAGQTNRQIGEAIGATEHQVWRWRRGVVKPSAKYLAALVHLLFADNLAAIYVDHDSNGDDEPLAVAS